jgi:hypothetical protein
MSRLGLPHFKKNAIIMGSAKNDGRIERVVPHLVDAGLSILQYTNDTIYLWSMIF